MTSFHQDVPPSFAERTSLEKDFVMESKRCQNVSSQRIFEGNSTLTFFLLFCDFITLEKGRNSRNTALKIKIFFMHTASRILIYVCYLVKIQILVVLNVHTVNFSEKEKVDIWRIL